VHLKIHRGNRDDRYHCSYCSKYFSVDWVDNSVTQLAEHVQTPPRPPARKNKGCNKCGFTWHSQESAKSAKCPKCKARDVRSIREIDVQYSSPQSVTDYGLADFGGKSAKDLVGKSVNVWTCSECGQNILRETSTGPPKVCPHCGKA